MRHPDNCRCRSRFCYMLKTRSPAIAATIKLASATPTDVVCLDNGDIGSRSLSKGAIHPIDSRSGVAGGSARS